MKIKANIIPLLLVTPLLFMANSPYPYGMPEPYEDYEIKELVYTPNSNGGFDVTLTIENKGEGYMNVNDRLSFYTSIDVVYFHDGMVNRDARWVTTCLAPHKTMTLYGNNPVTEEYSPEDYVDKYVNAYVSYEKVDCSGVNIDELEIDNDSNLVRAYFSLIDLKIDNNYHYTYIFDMEVKGESIALAFDGNNFEVDFNDATLKKEDIVFNGVYSVQGTKSRLFIEDYWMIGWIVFGVVLGIGIVISLGFLPLIITSSIKKAKKKEVGK